MAHVDLPPLPAEVRRLVAHLRGRRAWLVGGAVRDLLLGRRLVDLDLAAEEAEEVARGLARGLGGTFVLLDAERGVARVAMREGMEIDVARLRAPSLEEDLLARDYTINAMALALGDEPRLIDPAGGAADLSARRLRLLGREVLVDDPLRGLRGLRLAATLGLELEGESAGWIGAEAPRLAAVAGERVRDELFRLLASSQSVRWVRRAAELELLAPAFGLRAAEAAALGLPAIEAIAELGSGLCNETAGEALPGPAPVTPPALAALSSVRAPLCLHLAEETGERPRFALLLLAALLAPLSRERAAEVGERLHLARQEVRWLATALAAIPAVGALPVPPGPRAAHRFFRSAGPAGVGAALLSLAPALAGEAPLPPTLGRAAALLEAWFLAHDRVVAPPRLVSGEEVAELLGGGPGPAVGEALRSLAEAQAAGEVSSRDEALAFLRRRARA